MTDTVSTSRQRAGRLPTHSFWIALGGIALLLLADRLMVQPPLLRLLTDAPVINVAGRQRMLSQRLTKAALALDRAEEADRPRHLSELRQVLELWSKSHDDLRKGNAERSLPGHNSEVVRRAFDELEPSFQAIRAAAEAMIEAADNGAPTRNDLPAILEHEAEFLARMERIVGLYEQEARARVDRLIGTGWAVTAAILLGLIGVGWRILLPTTRLIHRQFQALESVRDDLEARVQERTLELQRLNLDLQQQAHERAEAEARHRALLEQFSHVARTNSIGEMATSLAHELNQPLGAIANYAEGCLVALEAPQPALEDVRGALQRLLATTLRAGQIIKRIRRFVTRHEPIREPFEPEAVLAEVAELFQTELDRLEIELQRQLAPDLPKVCGDPIQIQQVLVNLVRNAIDAISMAQPKNPKILVEIQFDDSETVEFRVIDNGEGIATDRQERVFDAFFSTRAEGMGMGLAISRTIVEAHQGRIDFESDPGVRTVFSFTLPPASLDDAATFRLHRGR